MHIYEKLNVARQVAEDLKRLRQDCDRDNRERGGWIVVTQDGQSYRQGKTYVGNPCSVQISDSCVILVSQGNLLHKGVLI